MNTFHFQLNIWASNVQWGLFLAAVLPSLFFFLEVFNCFRSCRFSSGLETADSLQMAGCSEERRRKIRVDRQGGHMKAGNAN